LDLGKCDVTNNGLRQLAKQLPQLRKLSVRGCELVGDAGVAAVVRGCSNLLHLNIQECSLSQALVRSILNSCSNCYVEHSLLAQE
jgi:hypothetical protein